MDVEKFEAVYSHLRARKNNGVVVLAHRYARGEMRLQLKGTNKRESQKDCYSMYEVLNGLAKGTYNLRMSVDGNSGSPSVHAYEEITVGKTPLPEVFTRNNQSVIGVEKEDEGDRAFNQLLEGDRETALRYKRNRIARHLCLEHFGYSCQVCNIRLREIYNIKDGKDFIHIHHLKPFSLLETTRYVDPREDLVPVCPNCHAMLHMVDEPLEPLTVTALRNRMIHAPKQLILVTRCDHDNAKV